MASAYVQKRTPMVLATTLLAQAAAATDRLTDAKRLQFKQRYTPLRLDHRANPNPTSPPPEESILSSSTGPFIYYGRVGVYVESPAPSVATFTLRVNATPTAALVEPLPPAPPPAST
jgi:hypothetical protein